MIKNKEIRYRFSFLLNKKDGSLLRIPYFIGLLFVFAIFMLIEAVTIKGTIHGNDLRGAYKNAILLIIIVSMAFTLLASFFIHKDVKTKNLLIKVSLGMNYKEYIRGSSVIYLFPTLLVTLTAFLTIGINSGNWVQALEIMTVTLAFSLILAALQTMICVLMANVKLMATVSLLLIVVIIGLVVHFKIPNKQILDWFNDIHSIWTLPVSVIVLSTSLYAINVKVIPNLNFVNWFDDSIKVPGMM